MAAEQVACYFCIINLFILINFQIKNNCYHNPGITGFISQLVLFRVRIIISKENP
jgi:hypothetical protein